MSTRLSHARYLEHFETEGARLRAVALRDPAAEVPTCPGWDVEALLEHTALVYAHKLAALTEGGPPTVWPSPSVKGRGALELFDDVGSRLLATLRESRPETPAWSFWQPEQTVGFWGRRMAHETLIHRLDAELALDEVTALDPGLALDGVDEVLHVFLVRRTDALGPAWSGTVRVQAGETSWGVRLDGTDITVSREEAEGGADASVGGPAADVLAWCWGRGGLDGLTVAGDIEGVAALRERLARATT